MNEWVIALKATGIISVGLGVVGWLCRQLIVNRLARTVAHEFDVKMARFRSELDRQREMETAVVGTALGAVTAAQTTAQTARLDASVRLWKSTLEIRASNTVVTMLDILTDNELSRLEAEHPERLDDILRANPKVRTMEIMVGYENVEEVRPLVSDIAWAYFFAYRAYTFRVCALVQWYGEGRGFTPPFIDKVLSAIGQSALTPAELASVSKLSVGRLMQTLNTMETKILNEIRDVIAGKHGSEDSLRHAHEIIRAIEAA
jgi:hypothetical protein